MRDPRSTWLSRAKISAATRKTSLNEYLNLTSKDWVTNLDNVCKNLENDLTLLENIHKQIHTGLHDDTEDNTWENYKLVRYEDIATKPVAWAKAMYTFLDIPWHSDVYRWIEENTHTTKSKTGYIFFPIKFEHFNVPLLLRSQ